MCKNLAKLADRAIQVFFVVVLEAASIGCLLATIVKITERATLEAIVYFMISVLMGWISYLQIKEIYEEVKESKTIKR